MRRTLDIPAGTSGVEALATAFERGFAGSDLLTLGLEEELILVHARTLAPVDAIERVLELSQAAHVQAELRAAQVELVMPVSLTAADLARELAGARTRLVAALDGRVRLLAAGTHPLARGPMTVTERPRYRRIAREHSWAIRRGVPSGLHVHVGIGDPDEALAVYNAARTYLPELAAFAANSPYFEGADSGLASTRLKLVEDLPRSGIPPAFGSWLELASFVTWGSQSDLFPDLTYLWWDLRPRPDLGTIEFRVADTQTDVAHTAAIVALCQSLISALRLRLRAGELLPVWPTHVLAENRWRALRDGLEARLVDPVTCESHPARTRIANLLLELEPYAAELGCDHELGLGWQMLVRNGAVRQRDVARARGPRALLGWLVRQTEQ